MTGADRCQPELEDAEASPRAAEAETRELNTRLAELRAREAEAAAGLQRSKNTAAVKTEEARRVSSAVSAAGVLVRSELVPRAQSSMPTRGRSDPPKDRSALPSGLVHTQLPPRHIFRGCNAV